MLSIEPWITETRTAHSDEFLAEIKSQSIIYRRSEMLLRSQVPFRRLYGGMAQQQLDLLQITTGPPAQLRAGTPQVMWRELAEFGFPGIAHHQAPDDFSSRMPVPSITPALVTGRKRRPSVMPAAAVH